MKEKYINRKFKTDALEMLRLITSILREYVEAGRDYIAKMAKSYKLK